jgi:hypothetical protein
MLVGAVVGRVFETADSAEVALNALRLWEKEGGREQEGNAGWGKGQEISNGAIWHR